MVRQYLDKPLPGDIVKALNERIEANNERHGLCLALAAGNSDGIGGMAKVMLSRTVQNYFILAGRDSAELDEKLGYCGADLMLYAQTLGLNTWWVGGMYSGRGALKNLGRRDVRVNGVIAVGYGKDQGVPHRSKSPAEVSEYKGEAPLWFTDGVEALLLAPTAMNKQPYMVRGWGDKAAISAGSGRFAGIDLGIGKYHFEAGAGRENFEWELQS